MFLSFIHEYLISLIISLSQTNNFLCNADDADISFSGSGGPISVASTGAIVVSSVTSGVGSFSVNVLATDTGSTPGTLSSDPPAVITILVTVSVWL